MEITQEYNPKYILVKFPYYQKYMEDDNWKYCYPINSDSINAYMIP